MLADLISIHTGCCAVIYGKGPSLRTDHRSIPDNSIKIAINDAGYYVDDVDYLMMHDPIPEAEEILSRSYIKNPDVTMVLPSCSVFEGISFVSLVPPEADVIWYTKVWELPRKQSANGLWAGSSTTCSAVQFANLIGCRQVRFVGFDGHGTESYAEDWPLLAHYANPGDQKKTYMRTNAVASGVAAFYCMREV